MNILVTGGAGFIGSHLCEYLLKKGNNVICVDNFFTGSKSNVQHLLQNKNFTLLPHDIIQPLFLSNHVDQVYNLACPASPIHYQFNAIRTIKANTIGMINMLGLAKLHKARFLQASTSEVYGDPLMHPQTEDYFGNVNPNGIRSCYDEGKRVAEALCFDYHRQNDVNIRVARIFNTYGPRMAVNDGRVVSNFIVQALKNDPLTLYGDGTTTRSFCFVTDLVQGLYKLMQSDVIGPVNLGNPNEVTLLDLAERIIRLTSSKSSIQHEAIPSDDPKRRRPDITMAQQKLNWQPLIDLNTGLEKTIEYFKSVVCD